MLAVNYETWRWDSFRLEDLEKNAMVLTLVEGDYWNKYIKRIDGFWYLDGEDKDYIDSYVLEDFLRNDVGPEEYIIIAPNGLMSE